MATHAVTLRGRDIVTGEQISKIIIWADRTYDTCPSCGQPINVSPGCPVNLNTGAGQGGRLEEWSQMHGCGQWLHIDWVSLDGDATEREVADAREDLSA